MHNNALQKYLEYKRQKEDSERYQEDPSLKILRSRTESLKQKVLKKNLPTTPITPKIIKLSEPEEPLFPAPAILKAESVTKTVLSLELYSKEDILAKTNTYIIGPIKDAIQNAAGIFCKESNGWVIPIKMYQCLKRNLEPIKGVAVNEVPDFVVRALADDRPLSTKKWQFDYANEIPKTASELPQEVLNQLYPFQVEGVNFALSHFGRALIGDEMGVGKTIQAIATAYAYIDE